MERRTLVIILIIGMMVILLIAFGCGTGSGTSG